MPREEECVLVLFLNSSLPRKIYLPLNKFSVSMVTYDARFLLFLPNLMNDELICVMN